RGTLRLERCRVASKHLCFRGYADTFDVGRGLFQGFFRSLATLARDDVWSVPVPPVMLRGGRFIRAVPDLRLTQELCQCRDVQAQSPTGKPGLDFLEQPTVAVRIAECGKRAVARVIGRRSADAAVRTVRMELRARHRRVEYLADVCATRGKF